MMNARDVILMLTPYWTERFMEDERELPLVSCSRHPTNGTWSLCLILTETNTKKKIGLSFEAMPGPPAEEKSGLVLPGREGELRMKHWGLERLGPGVWAVQPSVSQPGMLHAYVVLRDVPEPAPWETVPELGPVAHHPV